MMEQLASPWTKLNPDNLELIFEQLFEMEPREHKSLILKHHYYKLMGMPWITSPSLHVLKTSSLVCHQWRKYAQSRLFRCVVVRLEREVEEWLGWAAKQSNVETGGGTSLPFFVVDLQIDYPSPAALKLLKHSTQLQHLAVRYVDDQHQPTVMPHSPKLVDLPSLKSLSFSILKKKFDSTKHFLAELSGSSYNLVSYHTLASLLIGMPNLKRLLVNADFQPEDKYSDIKGVQIPAISLPQLTHFEVIDCDYFPFEWYNWVLSNSLSFLRHLSLSGVSRFPDLLKETQSSLQSLSFHYSEAMEYPKYLRVISPCSNVTNLAVYLHELDSVMQPDAQTTARLFIHSLPRTVQTLHLAYNFSHSAVFSALNSMMQHDSEEYEPALLPCLRRLILDVNRMTQLMDAEDLFNDILPKTCRERGVELRVLIGGKVEEEGRRRPREFDFDDYIM